MHCLHTPLVLALAGMACRPPAAVEEPPIAPAPSRTTAPSSVPATDTHDSLQLVAEAPRAALTAVFLDEQGRSAVTLDADGRAHLWPDVRAETPTAPWVLPLRPSVWVSMAAGGAHGHVVAALDADGMARIGRIDIGAGTARWTTVSDTLPIYGLREVHVLAGDRIVTLSHNHDISLLTHAGKWLAGIDAPDFFPQQLRVAAAPGRPPSIVAVFADPPRVQAVAVVGDELVPRGEPRQIDRETVPTRDELVLTPDGAHLIAAHHRGPGRGFLLERIDLTTDDRRWISGELDLPGPLRIHVADAQHLLLESGAGEALWLDHSLAASERAHAGTTPRRRGPLPGSPTARRTSVVAGGVRALVDGTALIVDDLAVDHHLRIEPELFQPTDVALDADGEQVAWLVGDRLIVERIGAAGQPRTSVGLGRAPRAVVFAGSTQLLVVDDRGEATLHRANDGATIATARAGGSGGVAAVAYHPRGERSGELAWSDSAGSAGVVLVHDGETLGPPRVLGGTDRAAWSELMRPAADDRRRLAARLAVDARELVIAQHTNGAPRYIAARNRLIQLAGAATVTVTLGRGGVRMLAPAGPNIAVVERAAHEAFAVLSVYEFSGGSGRRRWSRALATADVVMRWSGDGRRLGVAGDGGLVLDAASGAAVVARHDLGLTVCRLPDAAPP